MAAKFETDGLNLTRGLLNYILDTTVQESPTQIQIREETAATLSNARMMISPVQGSVVRFLARMLRPSRVVEVGVFTGYSATWLADALDEGGTLVACELNQEYLDKARAYWAQAGLTQIRGILGPGQDGLQTLLDEGWAGTVDVMFVDADKTGYDTYYTMGCELLRPGGLMLFDNTLWGGSVADPSDTEPSTEALRAISRRAAADDRVDAALLSVGDGLLAVLKK
ncbi:MAG: SAM-dependent methyltransferase [Myxococcales bacterium]|nr:SAM-dependent methyltransferase [Myxococcales bacterium]